MALQVTGDYIKNSKKTCPIFFSRGWGMVGMEVIGGGKLRWEEEMT